MFRGMDTQGEETGIQSLDETTDFDNEKCMLMALNLYQNEIGVASGEKQSFVNTSDFNSGNRK